MRLLACLVILVGALGLVTAGAAQVGKPFLKGDVSVSGEVVLLGDVVGNAGPAAATPVFRAPPLGRAGTIQAARVVEAARAAGLDADAGSLAQIVVSRASRRLSKAEIETAMRAALAARYALDNAEVVLALDGAEGVVHVEVEATGELQFADLAYDARAKRVEAALTIAGSRTLTLKPQRVAGQVIETLDVPILTRAIARGESLRDGDVRVERRPRAEFPVTGFINPSALAGRVARANLAAGAVLRDGDLARQDLVEKNGIVTVVYEIPGVALSMRGKALEGGGLGDVVQVQNTQSKRVLQGTVTGLGLVSVAPGQAGQLADARKTTMR